MVNQGSQHTRPEPICTLVSMVGMCVCCGFSTLCDLSLRSAIATLSLFIAVRQLGADRPGQPCGCPAPPNMEAARGPDHLGPEISVSRLTSATRLSAFSQHRHQPPTSHNDMTHNELIQMLTEALDDFDEPASCSSSSRVRDVCGMNTSTHTPPITASSPHLTMVSLFSSAQQLRVTAQRHNQHLTAALDEFDEPGRMHGTRGILPPTSPPFPQIASSPLTRQHDDPNLQASVPEPSEPHAPEPEPEQIQASEPEPPEPQPPAPEPEQHHMPEPESERQPPVPEPEQHQMPEPEPEHRPPAPGPEQHHSLLPGGVTMCSSPPSGGLIYMYDGSQPPEQLDGAPLNSSQHDDRTQLGCPLTQLDGSQPNSTQLAGSQHGGAQLEGSPLSGSQLNGKQLNSSSPLAPASPSPPTHDLGSLPAPLSPTLGGSAPSNLKAKWVDRHPTVLTSKPIGEMCAAAKPVGELFAATLPAKSVDEPSNPSKPVGEVGSPAAKPMGKLSTTSGSHVASVNGLHVASANGSHVASADGLHVASTNGSHVASADGLHMASANGLHVTSLRSNTEKLTKTPKPIGEVHVAAKPVGVLTTISVKTPKPIGEVDTAAKPVGVLTVIPVNGSRVTSLNGLHVTSLNGSHVASLNGSHVTSLNGWHVTSVNGSHVALVNGSHVGSVKHAACADGACVASVHGLHVTSINSLPLASPTPSLSSPPAPPSPSQGSGSPPAPPSPSRDLGSPRAPPSPPLPQQGGQEPPQQGGQSLPQQGRQTLPQQGGQTPPPLPQQGGQTPPPLPRQEGCDMSPHGAHVAQANGLHVTSAHSTHVSKANGAYMASADSLTNATSANGSHTASANGSHTASTNGSRMASANGLHTALADGLHTALANNMHGVLTTGSLHDSPLAGFQLTDSQPGYSDASRLSGLQLDSSLVMSQSAPSPAGCCGTDWGGQYIHHSSQLISFMLATLGPSWRYRIARARQLQRAVRTHLNSGSQLNSTQFGSSQLNSTQFGSSQLSCTQLVSSQLGSRLSELWLEEHMQVCLFQRLSGSFLARSPVIERG